MSWIRGLALCSVLFYCSAGPARAQSEFGFVNTRPSGQPYLTPEESVKRLKVPPGWEVKVFAAEPDIINPISFTVDERGRLWVVECYEYPKRTAPGKKPRDRIKVLEDTTGSGKADKVTVWAEGKDLPRFDLASGIEVGHGGVFLGAAPYLFYLRDAHGTGRCDHHEILLQGFGSQDTHETLNTLQWGPDGRLYGLHGIFTQSKIGGIQMTAAVWRYDVAARKFEVFAEGTSNPWGLDFDAHGQAFLVACVIPHAFHMIPGGTYIRQAGSSLNPYAYGYLNEISDHRHHQESGWAHAGMLVLQGDHIPAEYQDSLLMGSIHGCSIKRDLLERRGSTFVARHRPDFLVSGDKNFRPINMRWGPDGSIYVIDWHDQNPCHQAHPDSWDLTHGRIYKIQRAGTKQALPGDVLGKSSAELVEWLKNDNPWWYRTALRVLGERRDQTIVPQLEQLALHDPKDKYSLRGVWGLYAVGALDEALAEKLLQHSSPWVRAWAVRLLGEGGRVSDRLLGQLIRLAGNDPSPDVRLQLASTAQRLRDQDRLPLLEELMAHKEDVQDPCLPLMIWLAYEPAVADRPRRVLAWLKDHAPNNPLITEEIVPRAVRRLIATERPEDLAAVVRLLGGLQGSRVRRRALEGVMQALEHRLVDPPAGWQSVFAALLRDADPEVPRLARRLAVKLRDLQALRRSLVVALDPSRPIIDRVDAVHDLGVARPDEAWQPLEQLLARERDGELCSAICRALAAYDHPEIARSVLANWKSYPATVRVEAVNLLAGRREWARQLLGAVGRNQVPRTELHNNTILRIRAMHDSRLNGQIEAVWGRVRESSSAELNALIDRMRTTLAEGRGSPERGRKVFEDQCAKCHRWEGKGHDVGPSLDGAARDIDYLLVNILDPNRVVGQPYFTRFVALKNGRVETGLLAAEDGRSITLKTENDALKVIQRRDIDEVTVQEKSLMPEGLNKNMTLQDFRDLIRYLMANPFLTEVALAGPYSTDDRLQLNQADPLHTEGVTWSWPLVGPSGKIPLSSGNRQGSQRSYVVAEVTAPGVMRTRLQLGAGSSVKAWLNDRLIYQGTPGREPALPDQAGVDVTLQSGVNRLLIEATYVGKGKSLYARFLDPQRKLQYPAIK
jgi:putative membrane-bound dehydrogenase-like protein